MWDRNEWRIFLLFFILFIFFTKTYPISPNDRARLAGIQSVVENRTFAMDHSMFDSIDKVKIGEHFYSEKPVMSYLVFVPIYAVLYNQGITFANKLSGVYYLLTLLVLGLSTSIMLVYFYRFLGRYGLSPAVRFFFTFALGVGTAIFPYATVINNHALAAAFLFLSFYAALSSKNAWQYAGAGLLAGLTATFDIATGPIFLVVFSIWLLWRRIGLRKLLAYGAGASIPIAAYLLVNYVVSGSIIPFTLHSAYFNYPGSSFANGAGVAGQAAFDMARTTKYLWDITFGVKGLFIFNPLLLFSVAGLIITIAYKRRYRAEAIFMALGIVSTIAFFVTKTDNWGGCNYGFRYTVPIIPILFAYTPAVFKRHKVPALWMLFTIGLALSVFISMMGLVQHPWGCTNWEMIPNQPFTELMHRFFQQITIPSHLF